MPRGPGKKENYNLDYSRFSWLDRLEEDDEARAKAAPKKAASSEADAAAGPNDDDHSDMPPMAELLKGMPPELREAYNLMAISNQSGDENARRRATELALRSIERGGPQVKEDFIKNVSQQAPEIGKMLEKDLAKKGAENFKAETILDRLDGKVEEPEPLDQRINGLRKQMEKGAQATRKQLESMQKQQAALERLKTPEDIMKFITEGGMKPEDIQRIFSGDTAHMEECVKGMIEKTAAPGADDDVGDPEQAIRAAEALHGSLCGELDEEAARAKIAQADSGAPATSSSAVQEKPSERAARTVEPPARQVTIPDYRLQYQKDSDGRYSAVELKCSLPGVSDMSAIVLDVSEDHLRLNTLEPAPGYVVNAGPFPVPIDPTAARAKYSKRREELSITVPARAS